MKRLLVLGVIASVGAFGACGGSQGAQGPQGPAGENGEAGAPGASGAPGSSAVANPSVSAITPNKVFLARQAEVTISGYGTNWSSATTVDFGAGIKVGTITVASPTALVVDITIDKTAATGARDVKVTDGGKTDTYKGAFEVTSPISLSVQGVIAQGALLLANIKNLDTAKPFDTTSSVNPVTGATTYPNMAVTVPAGVTVQQIGSVSDFGMQLLVSVDVNAAAAAGDLDVVAGAPQADGGVAATSLDFPLPAGFTVAARSATALTSGTVSSATIANPYDSALFSLTPTAASNLLDWAGTTTGGGTPGIALLASPGVWGAQFANMLGYSATQTILVSGMQPVFGVYWDQTGGAGPISVTGTTTAVAATAAATSSDASVASAVVATALPFVLTGGDLSHTGSADWVKVTLPASQTTLRVQTLGDPNTDVAVAVTTNGTTAAGTTTSTTDTGTYVDATFTGLTGGSTYFVTFSQGTVNPGAGTTYTGVLR